MTYPSEQDLLECTTPEWGKYYPAANVNISVEAYVLAAYTRNNGRRLGVPFLYHVNNSVWTSLEGPPIRFHFRIGVAAYQVIGRDKGAKGGTFLQITVPGMNFRDSIYKAVFNTSQSGSPKSLDVQCYASSVSNLTCKTPRWGELYCAAVTRVILYENDKEIPVEIDREDDFHYTPQIFYDFFEGIDTSNEGFIYPNQRGLNALPNDGMDICSNTNMHNDTIKCSNGTLESSELYDINRIVGGGISRKFS